jgi:hypothetical protein
LQDSDFTDAVNKLSQIFGIEHLARLLWVRDNQVWGDVCQTSTRDLDEVWLFSWLNRNGTGCSLVGEKDVNRTLSIGRCGNERTYTSA